MPKNKLFLVILLIFLVSLGLQTARVVQADELEKLPEPPIVGKGGVLDKIAINLLKVLALVAVILFIYAGFLFLTSSGDPQKFDTAKKAVLYGIIGLLVAFSAWGLVKFIKMIFIPEAPPVEQPRPRPPYI